MKHILASAACLVGASAVALHRDCKFEISAIGLANGLIGQLSDGQCRIGGGYAPSKFNLDHSSGLMTDRNGWGCITTPGQVSQIQCDQGATGKL
jgi:hypothetical protein